MTAYQQQLADRMQRLRQKRITIYEQSIALAEKYDDQLLAATAKAQLAWLHRWEGAE